MNVIGQVDRKFIAVTAIFKGETLLILFDQVNRESSGHRERVVTEQLWGQFSVTAIFINGNC